jgi:hypothetical protein
VHEERFAARNTFRREFSQLLPCVAGGSQIAGAENFSNQEALWAVTLSFRARMQELRVISRGKTGGPSVVDRPGELILPTSHPS